MSIELHYLMFSILLGLASLIIATLAFVYQHGLAYALSPRDEQRPMTGKGARLGRAFSNFMETFAFFAVGVLIAQLMGIHNSKTELGAELYFWARLIYIPVYAVGIPGLRTLVWTGSIIGIALIFCGIYS